MIECTPIDNILSIDAIPFVIGSFLLISGVLIAILAVWNLRSDYMDGTIRKKPSTASLRGLSKKD